MKQTKLESALEILFNYLSGFILAYLVYKFIVMPNPQLKNSPFLVTVLFTVVSVLRSYFWRRFFNKRLHFVFANKLIKWLKPRLLEVTCAPKKAGNYVNKHFKVLGEEK